MAAAFQYFFRHEPDAFVFPIFSTIHIIILLLAMSVVWLIIKKRRQFAETKHLRIFLIVSLFLVQVALYGWFASGDENIRRAGLPLYHCRIAEIAMLIGLIWKQRFAQSIALYLGTYGSVFALLIPIMEPYRFPHVTNLAYFSAHVLMLWTVTYLLAVEGYKFERRSLIQLILFLNFANIIILLLNPVLQMNYAYFAVSPIFTKFFSTLPRPLYLLLLFVIYNLLVLLTDILGRKIARRLQKNT